MLLACGGSDGLELEADPAAEEEAAIINDPDGPPVPENPLPPAPTNLRVTERSSTSITVAWTDIASNETRVTLERSLDGGSYATIRTYGALSGAQTYTSGALAADRRYCFRVRETNANGTSTSRVVCAYTRPASSNVVGRLQLTVSVANVEDAGTDDGLSVRLNESSPLNHPNGNLTHMDYARDDFERNSSFTYDLDGAGVADLGDIVQIRLEKGGSDGVCLRDLELRVNGVPVFNRIFGDTASTCRWLDDSTGHVNFATVSQAELRAHPSWSAYRAPPLQLLVSQEELESRIEGLVGNLIHGTESYWGNIYGDAVEESRANDTTMRVDLDLAAEVALLPNPDVDVDLDLGVGFVPAGAGWELQINTINSSVTTDFPWWIETISVVLSPICIPVSSLVRWEWSWGCAPAIEDYITDRVEKGLKPIEKAINAGQLPCPNGPQVTVRSDGSLFFSCR